MHVSRQLVGGAQIAVNCALFRYPYLNADRYVRVFLGPVGWTVVDTSEAIY